MLVRDVMNPEVARVSTTATFSEAARQLCAVGWSELAVTDADDALVGVLALGDLLRALFPDLDELVRLGQPLDAAFEAFLAMGRDLIDQPVGRLVITDPVVVAPDDPLLRAATVMVSRQIHRLFVVEETRVVGALGRADICRGALTA